MNDENEIFLKAKALFAPELEIFATLFEGLINSTSTLPTEEHISAAHRAKGGAGFLGFSKLKEIADKTEIITKQKMPIAEAEKLVIRDFIKECKETAEKIRGMS